MRKLKLLLASCALLVCAGVQAQKDVTSQYITNATLSNGTTGWTNVNFNAPVQGSNTVGYASECYAGWGSLEKDNYSLTQTITLPEGHYTLVNYSFFRYGLNADTDASKSLAYLKAGEDKVLVKTLGSITAPSYANSQAEGANAFDSKMYRNTLDFTIAANDTPIEIGLYGTFDLKQSWMICGMFELINNDIAATMDAPFDVTGYITNPGFEYRNMTGWTQSPEGYFGTQGNSQGFKVGGYYAEKWQPSASGALPASSMSQTLTDLPAGFYKLTANLGGNGTYISLNGKTANWEADKDYTVGYVLAENEDLVITAGKTAEGTANWIHFDNFRLQFCGDVQAALTSLLAEVTDYESKLSAADYSTLYTNVTAYDQSYSDVDELLGAIDAVQALYESADLFIEYSAARTAALAINQEAPMNGSVLSELTTALATSITMSSTASEKVNATNALKTKTANATASIANYVEAKAILDAANSYDEAGQESYAANETIAAIQNAYDNGTLTAVSADQKTAAKTALATACKAQVQPTNGCDMTPYIVNPGIDGNSTGWTCNKLGNTDNTGGPMKPSNDALEYWGVSATDGNKANRNFDYYQTITELPNGVYTIGADLLNSTNGEAGANWNGGGNAGVYGKTNCNEVIYLVTTDSQDFTPYTTDQIVVYDGSLTIGIKNTRTLTGRWFAADNFKLTYVRQLEESDKSTFTASFVNGGDWPEVHAYVWSGEEKLNGNWPGNTISKSGEIHDNARAFDVYTYSITAYGWPENIIFNIGSDANQTSDLPFVDGMLNTDKVTFSPVYAVVGSKSGDDSNGVIFSGGWNQATTTDILTESAGSYTKTYSNQTLDKQTVKFKVIKKDYKEAASAKAWYPASDQTFSIPVKGKYDITITFNGNEGSPVVTGEATKVSEAVTISDKRWATTVTNSPLNFSGVTEFDAYTATVSDSKVVLTKVDDVQAETGLVLKLKDGEDPATFYVPLAVSSSTDKGSLKHSSTDTYDTWHNNGGENNKFYGLYVNGEGDAQFTLINCSAENEVTIPAQKAFLLLNNGVAQARLEIVYDDETTGISNLNAETGAEDIYNLNGQRVTAPAKGRLYIVNGKKVVKK